MAKVDILTFADRPVAFYPALGRVAGGAAAGLFLSQLLYWTGRGANDEGWIWKTRADWEAETCLSRAEQETARRQLRELGVLEERRGGAPARLYYRLDVDRLAELVEINNLQNAENQHSRMRETDILDCGKPANKSAGNPQSYITETTTETTTKTLSRETGTSPKRGGSTGAGAGDADPRSSENSPDLPQDERKPVERPDTLPGIDPPLESKPSPSVGDVLAPYPALREYYPRIWDSIRAVNPYIKVPAAGSRADQECRSTLNKLVRIDGYPESEVVATLKWVFEASGERPEFWRRAILSPASLRIGRAAGDPHKFAKVYAQYKQQRGGKGGGQSKCFTQSGWRAEDPF